MRPGVASRTAEHNALFRALEAHRPAHLRVADDPLAEKFLHWPLSPVAALPGLNRIASRVIDRRWPGVRTAVVARTRLIDDLLIALTATAAPRQLAILGAGYDTRAHRIPDLAALTTFEVDHPDTQRRKRAAVPDAHVTYVPCDFSDGALSSSMAAAGFDPSVPTLFLWEGCTNYLTADAVDATLRWIAKAAPGSSLVFTYVDRAVVDDPTQFAGGDQLTATLDKVGERFTFGLDPAETARYLAERGLTLESDLGATEFRRDAYGVAADHIQGHEFYRVAVAHLP